MKKAVVIFGLLLLVSVSGGCAVVPAIMTTGASFAVPQGASVAISAVSTVHKTALVAADERQMDEMISDKMVSIQAEAMLLTARGVDMEAICLNGDLYVVGEYDTEANRDNALQSLAAIKDVKSIKGVVKPMPDSLVGLIKPAITDKHAETVINSGLIEELHIKSANVDVYVIQGEAVMVGVVRDAAEEASVIQLVERLKPRSETPIVVTSLLARQDMFEAGLPQLNSTYALNSRTQPAHTTPAATTKASPTEIIEVPVAIPNKPEVTTLAVNLPTDLTSWQKARLKMKHRILAIAKTETDPQAKRELITLSSQVRKDTFFSIEGRLVRCAYYTSNDTVRQHVNAILAEIAPDRVVKVETVAMH